MNQIFSFRRFWLLIKLDFAEKGRNYLMMGGMLITLMFFLMLPIALIRQYTQVLIMLHALALFMVVMFGGSLFTSQIFQHYSTPATAIAAIMIPASRLEKFLSAIFTNLLFVVPFMLIFLKTHTDTIIYANAHLTSKEFQYNMIPANALDYFVAMYLVIQGAVLLGSIYFKKFSYIKSAIVFFLVYLLVGLCYLWQAYHLADAPMKLVSFPFTSWDVYLAGTNERYHVDFPEGYQHIVYAFPVFLLLAFWLIAFVRLREKQI
jgi:hypothetical protein